MFRIRLPLLIAETCSGPRVRCWILKPKSPPSRERDQLGPGHGAGIKNRFGTRFHDDCAGAGSKILFGIVGTIDAGRRTRAKICDYGRLEIGDGVYYNRSTANKWRFRGPVGQFRDARLDVQPSRSVLMVGSQSGIIFSDSVPRPPRVTFHGQALNLSTGTTALGGALQLPLAMPPAEQAEVEVQPSGSIILGGPNSGQMLPNPIPIKPVASATSCHLVRVPTFPCRHRPGSRLW